MRVVLILLAAGALVPLGAAQADGPTYWNYSWYGAEVASDNSVHLYRDSCAGYGIAIPGANDPVPGILLPVTSVPDPENDCDPKTRVDLLVLP